MILYALDVRSLSYGLIGSKLSKGFRRVHKKIVALIFNVSVSLSVHMKQADY